MRISPNKLRRFANSEDGPTAVEYAVMLALIVVICLSSIRVMGNRTRKSLNKVAKEIRLINKKPGN